MRVLVACEFSGVVREAFRKRGHDAWSCDLLPAAGHGETKATCLWLKRLPLLRPTNIVKGREGRCWKESPGIKDGLTRQQRRSITLQGIADAMAEQWGGYVD